MEELLKPGPALVKITASGTLMVASPSDPDINREAYLDDTLKDIDAAVRRWQDYGFCVSVFSTGAFNTDEGADHENFLFTIGFDIELDGNPPLQNEIGYEGIALASIVAAGGELPVPAHIIQCGVQINEEAVAELAELVAGTLHRQWQTENREAYPVRRKAVSTDDKEWIEAAMENCIEIRLSWEESKAFDAKVTPDTHPGLESLGAGQSACFLDPNGDTVGIFVDIMATGYEELPPGWQQDNFDAAAGAAQLISDALLEGNSIDPEVLADGIHQQWLERNGEWAPEDQKVDYADLSEADKDRDRIILVKALEGLQYEV